MVPVGFVLQPGQVLAVSLTHQLLDRRDRTLDQVEHPHRAAGPQRPVEGREHVPPLLVGPQVVQDRSGQHDVELPVRKFDLPNVALDGRDAPGGRPADPLPGPVEHRLAQVDQGDVEVRQRLQQLEGVVAGPAAHVEDVPGVGRRGRRRLATSAIASGASTVADWPVSRLENRSTSASNRCRISSTVDFIASPPKILFDSECLVNGIPSVRPVLQRQTMPWVHPR